MKILFRISGGKAEKKQLGLGHVYRCKNLASEFTKNQVIFLLEDYGGAKKVLLEHNFKKIVSLPKNISLKEDIEKTIKTIKKEKISVLIIDKYLVNKNYVNEMKKNVKTVIITDLNNTDYNSDLLVNGFIGFKNEVTRNKFNSKCLLGPKYQILDKKFSKKRISNSKQYKILTTFGGYDEKNITSLVIKSITNSRNIGKMKIILGPATPKLKLSTKNQSNIILQKTTKNMFNEINKSEFGICSGGITTYEFAAVGIPFAIICQNRHQTITAKEWEKVYGAINLGISNKNIHKKIERILNNEINYKITKKILVDGLASKRVKQEVIKLIRKH